MIRKVSIDDAEMRVLTTGQPGGSAASAAGVSPGERLRAAAGMGSALCVDPEVAAPNHKPQATGSEPRLNKL